jgi:hypothetical protein
MSEPTLEIGTGFGENLSTKLFFEELKSREVIRVRGRMIEGAYLRINGEEYEVSNKSVQEVKQLLDQNGIIYS